MLDESVVIHLHEGMSILGYELSMPHKPLISIALCTYNGESFINEQLRSIAQATIVADEIIICDDASQDGTHEIVSKWIGRIPNIKLLRNDQRLGVTANFEKVLSLSHGDIIFLCDQDDIWHPHKITKLIAELKKRPELMLIHTNAHLIDVKGVRMGDSLFDALELSPKEVRLVKNDNPFAALLKRNLVTGATVAFQNSLLKAALPLPREWLHDEWLAIIAAAIGKIDFLEEELIDYRQHGGNQIGMRKLSWSEKIHKAFLSHGDFHLVQVRRTEVLLDRLLSLGTLVPPNYIRMVREKLAHHNMRAALPRNRLARIIPILREVGTGRYSLYSPGYRSIIRDLLEYP